MRLGVTVQAASYMTSLQIAMLGVAPLFLHPLAKRYGRLPIFLFCMLGSIAANVGSARSDTYGALAACRALGAFFISPAAALGSGSVQEMFFAQERARYMGVWTLMFTVGIPFGPFLFGFAIERVGYQWIFWALAIVSSGPLCLSFFSPLFFLHFAQGGLANIFCSQPGVAAGVERIEERRKENVVTY